MSGGSDDADDIFVKSRKKELMEKRLEREILKVDQELEELRKPKPTMPEQIADEAQKQFAQHMSKKMADKMISGLDNPAGTSVPSPSSDARSPANESTNREPEEAIVKTVILDEAGFERFRDLKPPQKDQLLPSVLPGISNLSRLLKLKGVPLIREGKVATYDTGEQMYKWTYVVDSTKPEDANRTRETILEKLGMDVEVLTVTEGVQRGLVSGQVKRKRKEIRRKSRNA